MPKKNQKKYINQPQVQPRPGFEEEMKPVPDSQPINPDKRKLNNKVVLITGGDSGIGKAVSILFAREGAHIALNYLMEEEDALLTKIAVEEYGGQCLLIRKDISNEDGCRDVIATTTETFGKINVLINNAALHWEQNDIGDISTEQLMTTFNTNFFSCFWLSKYALKHMDNGASIINTTSVTAYRGSPNLIDYAATKGAIVAFTRSLAINLAKKGIRVNAVAPGPIWTPLIVSSFDEEKVGTFGSDVPLERPGQPNEVAPCYLFLAADDNSYMTGQVLHPNGGEIINT